MISNRFTTLTSFFSVLIVSALVMSSAGAAKLYKWVGEDGMVHYSDKLPPEAAKGAHKQLNQRGQTTEVVKDPQEELEAEFVDTVADEERRRQAEIEARERMRDRILLDTFTTERDLELTRKDRVNAVDSQIHLMKGNNERTKVQIAEVQQKIDAASKAKGKQVPENLLKQLDSLNKQLAKNQEYISAKEEERRKLVEQFDADLKRFRELKGIEPPAEVDPKLVGDMTITNPPPPQRNK
jgi:hypothetical protein